MDTETRNYPLVTVHQIMEELCDIHDDESDELCILSSKIADHIPAATKSGISIYNDEIPVTLTIDEWKRVDEGVV